MSTFKVSGYASRRVTIEGWEVSVASYQLGERWACKVDNVSPGAVIGRGEGATRAEAERDALGHAASKLKRTRRLD